MLPSPSHRPRARLGPLLAALLGLVVGLLPGLTGPTAAAAAEPRAHTLAAGTFRNPLNSGPDPFMTHWKGAYYLTTTQGGSIRMWRSPSLGTLLTADPVTVWTDTDPSRNRNIWAPEFYRFGDRWYLYYTADDGVDDHHRLYVLESERDDPTGPYHFKAKLAPPNHADDFAIDAGILQLGGRLYLAYSGINQYQHNGINIAPMSNPYTVSGNAVAIDAAGGCPEVREGPEFLYRGGRVWMTYSTCDTGKPDYQVRMMSMPLNADPLVPGNWHQHQGAVFSRSDDRGVFGPGHHAFFTSPDGTEDWIVYHAKTTSVNTYTNRTTRAQRFTWRADGTPTSAVRSPWAPPRTCPRATPARATTGSTTTAAPAAPGASPTPAPGTPVPAAPRSASGATTTGATGPVPRPPSPSPAPGSPCSPSRTPATATRASASTAGPSSGWTSTARSASGRRCSTRVHGWRTAGTPCGSGSRASTAPSPGRPS